jgi:hypothetical protein
LPVAAKTPFATLESLAGLGLLDPDASEIHFELFRDHHRQ